MLYTPWKESESKINVALPPYPGRARSAGPGRGATCCWKSRRLCGQGTSSSNYLAYMRPSRGLEPTCQACHIPPLAFELQISQSIPLSLSRGLWAGVARAGPDLHDRSLAQSRTGIINTPIPLHASVAGTHHPHGTLTITCFCVVRLQQFVRLRALPTPPRPSLGHSPCRDGRSEKKGENSTCIWNPGRPFADARTRFRQPPARDVAPNPRPSPDLAAAEDQTDTRELGRNRPDKHQQKPWPSSAPPRWPRPTGPWCPASAPRSAPAPSSSLHCASTRAE